MKLMIHSNNKMEKLIDKKQSEAMPKFKADGKTCNRQIMFPVAVTMILLSLATLMVLMFTNAFVSVCKAEKVIFPMDENKRQQEVEINRKDQTEKVSVMGQDGQKILEADINFNMRTIVIHHFVIQVCYVIRDIGEELGSFEESAAMFTGTNNKSLSANLVYDVKEWKPLLTSEYPFIDDIHIQCTRTDIFLLEQVFPEAEASGRNRRDIQSGQGKTGFCICCCHPCQCDEYITFSARMPLGMN